MPVKFKLHPPLKTRRQRLHSETADAHG